VVGNERSQYLQLTVVVLAAVLAVVLAAVLAGESLVSQSEVMSDEGESHLC
jgi:hypothetical protein